MDKDNVLDDLDMDMKTLPIDVQNDLETLSQREAQQTPLERIQTFNLIKSIILRSSTKRLSKKGSEFFINIQLFEGLIKEIRQRMAIERSRSTNKGKDAQKVVLDQLVFLKDFSLINPVKILEALEKGVEVKE